LALVEVAMIQFLFTKRGHRAKLKDVFAEMSALLAEPSPRTRKSSPAKRAKVDGKTVENIPYGAAKVVARYFPQVYLAGRGVRGLSPPQMKEFFGRGGKVPRLGRGGVVYSWDGGYMILAGSMRRQGGFKSVDKKGIPLPVGDLDFVVVGPAFPPEPDLDALEGGRWSWLADLVKVELVSGGDRMRTYRFTATLPRTGERAPMHGKMRRAAAKSGVPTPATEEVEMQVNLMRADPAEMGATLMYATGPGGWNAMMRTKARRMGMKLNRYGLWDVETGKHIAGRTEQSIYDAMDKTYKDPWERGKK
jgi:hypothetical protein